MEDFILKLKAIEDKAKPFVEERISQFKVLGSYGSEEELFSELSFCVLTANWSANGGIKAQDRIGILGFVNYSQDELAGILSDLGHRFPHKRAEFIVKNRYLIGKLREITSLSLLEARKELVKEAKGIGWKEASHFLRNIGRLEVAILDRHILKVLNEVNLIDEVPKGWTEKRYLYIEERFKELSSAFNKLPGETDLYIWYLIKGKVEK
ncbi:MAG: N-glycosylase/DNA lyase [bacterium]|nr:N-glycosylase/DNA lyase [bacterium]